MTAWLRETLALWALNLRNTLRRPVLPVIVTIGFFVVVLVLVSVLSISVGLSRTYGRADRLDTVVLLSNEARTESDSSLGRDALEAIRSEPGVARTAHGPLVSPEIIANAIVAKRGSGVDSNVLLRGVTSTAFAVHAEVRLIAGRRFKSGVNEVIVGRQAEREYQRLRKGQMIHVIGRDWRVVGTFAADGGPLESEIWMDAHQWQSALGTGDVYSDAWVRLTRASALNSFRAAVTQEPRLSVQANTEKAYFAKLARGLTSIISIVGAALGLLMSFAAIVGAINLLHTHVSARRSEIAALRSLGFRRSSAFAATLSEALLFALLGGVSGALIAYATFNGYQAGTLSAGGTQQVAFQFAVTPGLLASGVLLALLMGVLGGLFPGIRIARMSITQALRDA